MAIADNPFTGGADSGDLTDNDNWSAAVAADQNLIFPADATTAYTLTGDLSATAVNSVVNLSACNFGADADNPVLFNVGSADGAATNLLSDSGTGTRYINVTNAADTNIMGRGTVELDGINNGNLRVNTAGTVTVGPNVDTPAEFDTIPLITGTGTVYLRNVTTQAAAAVPISMISGSVKLHTYSRLASVYQSGGIWRHYDNGVETHQSGAVAAIYQKAGTLFYNSTGTLTLLEAYGKADFSTEDLRDKVVTTGRFYKGSSNLDPNGTVTWTNPFETPYCSLRDITCDVGSNKKYTVEGI
ncbi:MAG TPA: hypothetical protein VMY35_08075 [Phycisphaerae bacterium]|nr:hypothetical protein [Phycisphaerae bacterium]